jgi:hypothetical protein
MTRDELFERCALLFDSDEGSLDTEEWEEQMAGVRHAIAKFERETQAAAIRWAAQRVSSAGASIELRELADRVEAGEATVPK